MPIGKKYDDRIGVGYDMELESGKITLNHVALLPNENRGLYLEFKIDKDTHEIIETKGLEDLVKLLEEGYELTLIKPAEVKKVITGLVIEE